MVSPAEERLLGALNGEVVEVSLVREGGVTRASRESTQILGN